MKILGQFWTGRSSPDAEAKTRTSGSLNQLDFLAFIDTGLGQVQKIFQMHQKVHKMSSFDVFRHQMAPLSSNLVLAFDGWHWQCIGTNQTPTRPSIDQFQSTNQPGFSTLPKKLKNFAFLAIFDLNCEKNQILNFKWLFRFFKRT